MRLQPTGCFIACMHLVSLMDLRALQQLRVMHGLQACTPACMQAKMCGNITVLLRWMLAHAQTNLLRQVLHHLGQVLYQLSGLVGERLGVL